MGPSSSQRKGSRPPPQFSADAYCGQRSPISATAELLFVFLQRYCGNTASAHESGVKTPSYGLLKLGRGNFRSLEGRFPQKCLNKTLPMRSGTCITVLFACADVEYVLSVHNEHSTKHEHPAASRLIGHQPPITSASACR